MIIEVPVYFSDSKKQIRVEVQIRTIAMDFWASLDHQLKYKKIWKTKMPPRLGRSLETAPRLLPRQTGRCWKSGRESRKRESSSRDNQ